MSLLGILGCISQNNDLPRERNQDIYMDCARNRAVIAVDRSFFRRPPLPVPFSTFSVLPGHRAARQCSRSAAIIVMGERCLREIGLS